LVLGFQLKDATLLTNNFEITKIDSSHTNENWQPVLGEVASIKSNYRQLNINLKLFDDGLAFQHKFFTQKRLIIELLLICMNLDCTAILKMILKR
jgi:hypothetical protein